MQIIEYYVVYEVEKDRDIYSGKQSITSFVVADIGFDNSFATEIDAIIFLSKTNKKYEDYVIIKHISIRPYNG